MSVELLAPAKNFDIAKYAIDYGADAVYIGSVGFGARVNASNSFEDISKTVEYAHKFFAKVYVTLNTIISDDQIEDVKKIIHKLYDIGVDALIIQDMAILKLAIDNQIPKIALHLSTQCNNVSFEQIRFFYNVGLRRIVLPREFSIDNIRKLKLEMPELDIEFFVHGALCVSYSGRCYLSHYIGGRSSNKGECAQPCRKKYSLVDDKGHCLIKDKHLLSLKDFNASEKVKEMIDAGVSSFKIEGRLKDEIYVKNVVGYYRKLIDKYSSKTSSGKIVYDFEPNINKVFNRTFTEYFLNGRLHCYNFNTPKWIGEKIGVVKKVNKDSFVIELDKDIVIHSQDGLTFGETGEYGCLVNKVEKNCVYPNNILGIKQGQNVYRNNDVLFEKNVRNSKTKRMIGVNITYEKGCLYAIDEDKVKVFISVNEEEVPSNIEKNIANFKKSLSKTGNTEFFVQNIDILTDLPFIPVSIMNEYRRLLFDKLSQERKTFYKIKRQPQLNYSKFYSSKISYIKNVHNSLSVDFYKKCGVDNIQFSVESVRPTEQYELMRTKHCLKYALNICKSDKNLFLVDEKNVKYPLKFDCKNCEMVILSPIYKDR